MNVGSLTDRLLKFCLVLVGRFRGGLGHVNVVSNVIFAGMSGSAIADAVGIGRVIIGMMTREGRYPVAYAAAITASAAIIGPIIPPSIPMVIYALVSDASIGYLFLGGVIPGLMLGVAFMIMNSVIARRRNYPVEPPVPLRDVPKVTVSAFPALLLPFHEDFSIDEASYRAHVRDVASVEGVSAITVNAHASEVASCTFDEQRRVLGQSALRARLRAHE